jgi:hypothetical protein
MEAFGMLKMANRCIKGGQKGSWPSWQPSQIIKGNQSLDNKLAPYSKVAKVANFPS